MSELAARSGLPADKLGRILRLLATKHVYNEGAPPPMCFCAKATSDRVDGLVL